MLIFFSIDFPLYIDILLLTNLKNKKMKKANIKNYLKFFVVLTKSIGNPLEERYYRDLNDKKKSGLVNYLNQKLSDFLIQIKNKKISLREMTVGDATIFKKVLNCRKLDQHLLSELSHELYGADERAKNFKLESTAC